MAKGSPIFDELVRMHSRHIGGRSANTKSKLRFAMNPVLMYDLMKEPIIARNFGTYMNNFVNPATIFGIPIVDDSSLAYGVIKIDGLPIPVGSIVKPSFPQEGPKLPLPLDKQYVGGLRLIRGWRIESYGMGDVGLQALVNSYQWGRGAQTAYPIPSIGTGGGFYGFLTPEWAIAQLSSTPVLGTFIGWGRCVRGEQGCRTQYGRVESLFANPHYCTNTTISRIKALAEMYNIPFITYDRVREIKTGLIPVSEEMIIEWKMDAAKHRNWDEEVDDDEDN